MIKPRIYYWVPEDCIFSSDGECLDAMPAFGAATLIVSHGAYAALKHEHDRLKNLLEEEIEKNQNLVHGNFGI